MNLNAYMVIERQALPSLKSTGIHDMSCILEVNGAAIEASVSDSDTPASAYFKAPQSLAPSPHIPTNDFYLDL